MQETFLSPKLQYKPNMEINQNYNTITFTAINKDI